MDGTPESYVVTGDEAIRRSGNAAPCHIFTGRLLGTVGGSVAVGGYG
jgi:hypothetical protein